MPPFATCTLIRVMQFLIENSLNIVQVITGSGTSTCNCKTKVVA